MLGLLVLITNNCGQHLEVFVEVFNYKMLFYSTYLLCFLYRLILGYEGKMLASVIMYGNI